MSGPAYEITGTAALSEFLGDGVVYRNLEPANRRLPGLKALWSQAGLEAYRIPRKTDLEYARVLGLILERARALDSGAKLQYLLYIGDTLVLDGTAFRNLKAATGWAGYAFIARDDAKNPPQSRLDHDWYIANRWSALPAFLAFAREQGIPTDERTAVVIDLDKTAIGARGRNDGVIDAARLEGVKRTVSGLLGPLFDGRGFEVAYGELNQPPYHPFTADNQDYLAYICLMLGAGMYPLAGLVDAVRAGLMRSFHDFIRAMEERRDEIAGSGLLSIHEEVWQAVQAGDPTPFKAFRYNEYLTTAARFGELPGATAEQALRERIVITGEVRQAALALRQQGALCFGVSDKPDEASTPQPAQAAQGYRMLHQLPAFVVSGKP
ncbi:MAG: hypothetical protein GXY76_09430 [Chloroflexi bacterium]|nr:hypothetical protein [Chloroflexota bacterium]